MIFSVSKYNVEQIEENSCHLDLVPCEDEILSQHYSLMLEWKVVWSVFIIPGFIITGGWNSAAEKKVELFNPLSGQSCQLPDSPEWMWGHSHCGNLLCHDKSCLKMNSTGSFSPASVSLIQSRYGQLCWSLPGRGGEVMVLGGGFSPNSPTTTEIVSADGSSTKPSWDLKYETMYDLSQ